MIVYNITYKIDLSAHNEWIDYMKKVHVPRVLETGYFNDHRMLRILEEDQSDGIAYAVQYHAKDMQAYFDFLENESLQLNNDLHNNFGDKYVSFSTVMKVV